MAVPGFINMIGKRLLIIGAGMEQVPAYETAKSLGLKIVGSDMNPEAPAFKLANDKIIASTYDAEASLAEIKKFVLTKKIDGVITLASDVPMTVAKICDELKLPGISLQTAKLTSNKIVQYNHLVKSQIAVPEFKVISSYEELIEIKSAWGLPLIIKPPDSRGSRGVLRLIEGIDLKKAFNESMKYSGTGSVIVQKFVEGCQISSETFVKEGKCYTAMLSGRNYDKLDKFAPYIIENGGCLPAEISRKEKEDIDSLITKSAHSLGIVNGHIKGDLVISKSGVMVLEFASRMGGGYAVSHSIPKITGVYLIKQHIKMALGEDISEADLIPNSNGTAILRFVFAEPGVVSKISDSNKPDDPNILLKKIYVNKGDKIDNTTDHTKRAGFVLSFGKSVNEATKFATEAVKNINISVM